MQRLLREPVNILLVDDIEKNLIATEALLSRPGLNVLRASSGVHALELLLEHEVALALIDVNMPHMDGFELAGLMRGNSRTASIPLIFITAAIQEPARSFRGYKAGAVDYLNKPVHPEILRSKVDVFIELYKQRKLVELQAAELQKTLDLNEMFNAVLGHDLKSPLQAVVNGAELIALRTQQTDVASAAKLIRSSALRMGTMITQLLELARVRAGKVELNLSEGDYGKVCEQIVREYTLNNNERTIKLLVEGDSSGVFDCDRVSRIVSNLIGNALQHGEPGSAVQVFVDGSVEHSVTISVQNEGAIAEEDIAHIFEPYHSGTRAHLAPGNLGLGLYIVRQLVLAHSGEVKVRSSLQEGTAFDILMPRLITVPGD